MGHHRLSRSQRIERLRRSLCIALHHLYSSGRTGFQVNFIEISTDKFNNKILISQPSELDVPAVDPHLQADRVRGGAGVYFARYQTHGPVQSRPFRHFLHPVQ